MERDQEVSSNIEAGSETVFPHESLLIDSSFYDFQIIKLIKIFEGSPVSWDNNCGKYGKTAKIEATCCLVKAFDNQYMASELFAIWRSLRASMLREVKWERENIIQFQWNFYSVLLFLKPALLCACSKSDEWSDEEKRVVINFYNENPSLWQHRMKDYHDKS